MTPAPFHPTSWTLVRQSGQDSEAGRAALSELCANYYHPVHHFIHTRRPHESRDLTHAFFEELLTRENIGSPDPSRGRFRTYLLGAVKHFLSRQADRSAAAKRGGDQPHIAVDDTIPSSPDDTTGFDRDWAFTLIRRAHDNLEAEMNSTGKSDQFNTLRPWLDGGPQASAEAAASTLGLTPNALRVAIHRLRQRFRHLVRAEIESTTDSPAEAEAEFRHLLEILTNYPRATASPLGS